MTENDDDEDSAIGQHFDTDAGQNKLAVALMTLRIT